LRFKTCHRKKALRAIRVKGVVTSSELPQTDQPPVRTQDAKEFFRIDVQFSIMQLPFRDDKIGKPTDEWQIVVRLDMMQSHSCPVEPRL
jgi:hypothetical protein